MNVCYPISQMGRLRLQSKPLSKATYLKADESGANREAGRPRGGPQAGGRELDWTPGTCPGWVRREVSPSPWSQAGGSSFPWDQHSAAAGRGCHGNQAAAQARGAQGAGTRPAGTAPALRRRSVSVARFRLASH